MNTGEMIRKLRKQKKMTQTDLGDYLGVQKSAVSKWERGAVENLKRDQIEKMADLFGVRPSYIMGLTDEPLKLTELEVKIMIAYRSADESTKKAIGLLLKVEE